MKPQNEDEINTNAIEIIGVSEDLRFKKTFPLLSSYYEMSSFIAKIMNNNLDAYREIITSKIQEIRERKNLSVNEVAKDDEVLELLKQRDVELKELNAAMLEIVVGVRKRSQSTQDLEDAILRVLENSDTRDTLAGKMGDTPETFARKMNRKKLSLKKLKEELNNGNNGKFDYELF